MSGRQVTVVQILHRQLCPALNNRIGIDSFLLAKLAIALDCSVLAMPKGHLCGLLLEQHESYMKCNAQQERSQDVQCQIQQHQA